MTTAQRLGKSPKPKTFISENNTYCIVAEILTKICRSQQALPHSLSHILSKIYKQTEYAGFIALAGPNVQAGGEIQVLS